LPVSYCISSRCADSVTSGTALAVSLQGLVRGWDRWEWEARRSHRATPVRGEGAYPPRTGHPPRMVSRHDAKRREVTMRRERGGDNNGDPDSLERYLAQIPAQIRPIAWGVDDPVAPGRLWIACRLPGVENEGRRTHSPRVRGPVVVGAGLLPPHEGPGGRQPHRRLLVALACALGEVLSSQGNGLRWWNRRERGETGACSSTAGPFRRRSWRRPPAGPGSC